MNQDLWWRQERIDLLSPMKQQACVMAQCDPPVVSAACLLDRSSRRFAQLWWLQWHARPDLRAQLLEWGHLAWTSSEVAIHPDTVAEWSDEPRWANDDNRRHEMGARIRALSTISMPIQWTTHLAARHWLGGALPFQATQSEAHGNALAVYIQAVPLYDLRYCLGRYADLWRPETFSRVFGTLLLQRAENTLRTSDVYLNVQRLFQQYT